MTPTGLRQPADGAPAAPLHPTVRAAAWVSFLTDFSSEIIYPLLPVFLTSVLGAGMAFVGVLEGIAESVASLLKLLSGWLSDRLGRRRPLVLTGYALSSAARPLVAAAAAPWHVLAVRVCDRVGKGLRGAPRDALIADLTPPESRGRAFGFQRAMDHAGAVAGPLVAFAVLHAADSGAALPSERTLRMVFGLAAVPALLAVAVAVLWVHDAPGAKRGPARPYPLSVRDWLRLDRRLLAALGVIALFALGNSSDAFLLLRARDLGVPAALLTLLWVALHVTKSSTATPGGALSDRVGRRRLILAGWLVYALVYAGFAAAGAPWHAWALFIVYGVYFGLTEGAERALVSDLARPEERGAAFGLYAFLMGVMAFPSSALMGFIWQRWGAGTAFLWGSVIALTAMALLRFAVLPPPKKAGRA